MFFFFYEDAYFYLCFMTEFEIVSRFRNGEERGEERRQAGQNIGVAGRGKTF